ncbi:MAG TPA: tRNA (guanosine(37)-N1)-methyltransferase TrmD, partial [Candidatus Parcubacteria bacterium]|nr:tRNA (guanosine(37)-N1)-methyltransferase TrmD [Candidatus Parcubacteria bacterium]
MIKFDIISIFPEAFVHYFKEGLIGKALKKKIIEINVHNLRNWADDKHKTVDDRPFGGGFGMVMKVEPIYKAVKQIKGKARKKNEKLKVILFSPRGKTFNQKTAYKFSQLDRIIMICGRYEGVDERVAKYIADEVISIGDYVLMGGEIPAMAVVESVARLIPGVIGKPDLLKERIPARRGRGGRFFLEYAQYTRPEVFEPEKGIKW